MTKPLPHPIALHEEIMLRMEQKIDGNTGDIKDLTKAVNSHTAVLTIRYRVALICLFQALVNFDV